MPVHDDANTRITRIAVPERLWSCASLQRVVAAIGPTERHWPACRTVTWTQFDRA